MELMSEVMIQTTRWGTLQTKLDGYVGFDTVQEQIKRKLLRRGFEFNIIVVGEYVSVCVCVCVFSEYVSAISILHVWSMRTSEDDVLRSV